MLTSEKFGQLMKGILALWMLPVLLCVGVAIVMPTVHNVLMAAFMVGVGSVFWVVMKRSAKQSQRDSPLDRH